MIKDALADVDRRLAAIRQAAGDGTWHDGDPERAHVLRDELIIDTLTQIAASPSGARPKIMAKAVIDGLATIEFREAMA